MSDPYWLPYASFTQGRSSAKVVSMGRAVMVSRGKWSETFPVLELKERLDIYQRLYFDFDDGKGLVFVHNYHEDTIEVTKYMMRFADERWRLTWLVRGLGDSSRLRGRSRLFEIPYCAYGK